MKVLLAHNFYQSSSPSGEDIVYRNEVSLLKRQGIDVVSYECLNDAIGVRGRLATAVNTVWSRATYQDMRSLIRKEKPDVAHFHNIWYLISPSAYYACRDAGVPVVQTLHNFRIFCANGLLMRNSNVCEECVGKSPWRSVAYGCYRGSRLYSIPVAFTEWFHRLKKTWSETIAGYITLTEFGKQKFIACGLPESKLYVKPNFLDNPPATLSSGKKYGVFIGRLSHEKGITVLLRAAKNVEIPDFHIKVVGDGPLRLLAEDEVLAAGVNNVKFTGRKNLDECMEILREASFLVMPALCYENFPMTIVEALAYGKPVIASNHGAMATIIEEGKTGLLFEPGNAEDLAAKIRWMVGNPDACIEMGRNARAEFETKYTAEKNFEILMDIYRRVLSKKQ